jgi:outer membrane lipoprotein SlyB
MLNRKLIVAAAAGLMVAACGSDPYAYSEPRYVSSSTYYSANDRGYPERGYNGNGAYVESGRVVAIDVVGGGGSGSGVGGAIVGGIVGGVLGHQIGSGRGNDAATAAGAIGGAVVGNQVAKRNDNEQYRVVVQLRDGREATFLQDSLNGIRVGDRVRVDGGRLYRD